MLALLLIALIIAYLNAFKNFIAKISLLLKKIYIYKIAISLFNNNFF